jgi:hypothetical protein
MIVALIVASALVMLALAMLASLPTNDTTAILLGVICAIVPSVIFVLLASRTFAGLVPPARPPSSRAKPAPMRDVIIVLPACPPSCLSVQAGAGAGRPRREELRAPEQHTEIDGSYRIIGND